MPHNQFTAAKIEEIQKKWNLLTAKLSGLEEQRITETRSEELFRLDQIISRVKDERQQLEQELVELQAGDTASEIIGSIPTTTSPATQKTKILFLAANPINTARLRLDKEVRKISTNLKLAKERDNLLL
ncbi:MAG: hypothetical protein D3924_15315, partial [Candidatus Electrothrix sp. AR4]|nr:hypothetical protein [Candidatus Electrothrix sp. AR4]